MVFVIIAAIIILILYVNKRIDAKKFITETQPYFAFLKEDDYEFLLTVKYGKNKNKKHFDCIFCNIYTTA